MAFFKFPWPGQKEQDDKPAKRSRTPQARAQAETIEAMRRRARHRLIGAAVLVLLGVVGFPLLFDTQPRPIPVDIPIEIPDRNKAVPLVVPAAPAPSAVPTASLPSPPPSPGVAGGLSDGEEVVASARPAAKPEPKPEPKPVAAKPEPKPERKPEPRPEPKPEPKPVPAPAPTPARHDDAARARALLEGRSADTAAKADEQRFIVQVGAFSESDKVREVRGKLERAGIKTYAQAVDTKDGKRTRVRVGPFQNRAEADKAAGRIKGLGLPASVLTL